MPRDAESAGSSPAAVKIVLHAGPCTSLSKQRACQTDLAMANAAMSDSCGLWWQCRAAAGTSCFVAAMLLWIIMPRQVGLGVLLCSRAVHGGALLLGQGQLTRLLAAGGAGMVSIVVDHHVLLQGQVMQWRLSSCNEVAHCPYAWADKPTAGHGFQLLLHAQMPLNSFHCLWQPTLNRGWKPRTGERRGPCPLHALAQPNGTGQQSCQETHLLLLTGGVGHGGSGLSCLRTAIAGPRCCSKAALLRTLIPGCFQVTRLFSAKAILLWTPLLRQTWLDMRLVTRGVRLVSSAVGRSVLLHIFSQGSSCVKAGFVQHKQQRTWYYQVTAGHGS